MRLLIDKQYESIMDGEPDPKVRRLGLLLDEKTEIPGATTFPKKPQEWRELKLYQFISGLIETMTGAWDREVMERYREEICFIAAKGIGMLEFDLEEERLEMLINSGRCAMRRYLQKLRL